LILPKLLVDFFQRNYHRTHPENSLWFHNVSKYRKYTLSAISFVPLNKPSFLDKSQNFIKSGTRRGPGKRNISQMAESILVLKKAFYNIKS